MAERYVGTVVLEVDGREIECTKFDVKRNTGRKSVKTMNSDGRLRGFAQGIEEITLSITAVVPFEDDVNWKALADAKVTYSPLHGGKRTSFLGCFTLDAGETYQADGEAVVDIQMQALREVTE